MARSVYTYIMCAFVRMRERWIDRKGARKSYRGKEREEKDSEEARERERKRRERERE